ncbi:MAG: amino acid adenylation domain-containing protein, partial [Henriciella sp.]|uniref:amino acid adenylation domain-containing protein n=1 Tax=Henriciella sp. TaxID=1968823 RepID=UPI003C734B4C
MENAEGKSREGAPTESVISLFDKVAQEFSSAPAIEDSLGCLSYSELRQLSGKLAAELAARGLKRGDHCALLVQRGRYSIALYLAILKLGAVYVPLDPTYPRSHLDFALSDCSPRLIIADPDAFPPGDAPISGAVSLCEIVSGAEQRRAARTRNVSHDAPAYVMYTSGSTGRPKGVIVPHRGIVRLVRGQDFIDFSPQLRNLQLSPLAFDGSTVEIWSALLNGGCLCIVDNPRPALNEIADAIERMGANYASFTTGLFHALIDYSISAFEGLTQVMVGGDVMSPTHATRLVEAYPDLLVINAYGPTENTVCTTCYRLPDTREDINPAEPLPIGQPINFTTVQIVDQDLNPVPDGKPGELVTGGDGVALGYLNRPDLTAEKFIEDEARPGRLLYRTGDLARRRPDGTFEFIGRNDRQIKISGKRVELDEIEHIIRSLPGVGDAMVAVHDRGDAKRIAAFVTAKAGIGAGFVERLNDAIRQALPEHMIPSDLKALPVFPLTPAGKLDRKALMDRLNDNGQQLIRMSESDDLATSLEAIFAAFIGTSPVDRQTSFFDLGLRSMELMKIHAIIDRDIASGLPLTTLFEHTTLQSLQAHVEGRANDPESAPRLTARRRTPDSNAPIAIIGMAGRFPKADSPAELWQNILAKRDCVTHFSDEELEDTFEEAIHRDPAYVKARPILDNPDHFDAGFFGMLAREAQLTDPQQRLFLEIAWEAFEDAGYDPLRLDVRVGVYAGTSMNTYFLKHILRDRSVIDELTSQFQIGEYQTLMGAADFVATRTAYKLNLKGPALSLQTACSTSLTAIGEAVQSLQTGRCDMALAGGSSITFPQKRGYFYEEGGMGSSDGVCRPFDSEATGTVFGCGAGVVLLKRLDDAIADGDPVYAVIRGVGINNDGSDKVGFTAPSVEGQARAIMDAYESSGIDPATVGYIEAHGTATPLGDPIEFAGLMKAFAADPSLQHCALGSVKANVGHLDAAAGVTGLMSAALALKNRTLPPLNHFTAPNRAVDPDPTPFYFNTEARAWEAAETPRRAGVSSFGVGGTNVHVALEEAPERPVADQQDSARPVILPISARSDAALARMKARLADYLAKSPGIRLSDVGHTLQSGRRPFDRRTFIVANTPDEAMPLLAKPSSTASSPAAKPPIVFMFPGQGAQYPGMGRDLYAAEPVYRDWIDRGAELLKTELDLDIRDMLLIDNSHDEVDCPIRSTIYAQPALFLTQFALAKLWMSRGISPNAMVGHSVGELVAAALAEAISFEDGLKLIARRGALMQAAEPGSMLAVRAGEDAVRALLTPDVDLAAINAAELCVVAGPDAAIDAFQGILDQKDIGHRKLHTSHAFHSSMMDGVVADLAKVAGEIDFAAPQIPYVSSVTGQWADPEEPVSGAYWAAHCRETVRFRDALATLVDGMKPVLLEVGPGRALSTFARQGLEKDAAEAVVQSMPDFANRDTEVRTFFEAAGKLWTCGALTDWDGFGAAGGQRISLPPYSFEPESHWIEAPAPAGRMAVQIPQAELTISSDPKEELAQPASLDRSTYARSELVNILAGLSGDEPDLSDPATTFWDLGYDSLLMGQVAQKVRRTFQINITFRQIMSDYPEVSSLIAFIEAEMPDSALPVRTAEVSAPAQTAAPVVPAASVEAPARADLGSGDVQAIFRDQLAAMQAVIDKQLAILNAASISTDTAGQAETPATPAPTETVPAAAQTHAAPDRAPLTEPQRELWLVAQLGDEASLTFNESFTLDLFGPLNRPAAEHALEALIARHDALRAHFSVTGEDMIVDPATQIPIEPVDLTGRQDAEADLKALAQSEMNTSFDLTRAPLARIKLVQLGPERHAVVFSAHHMICDGWSMNTLLREFEEFYAAEVEGRAPELAPALSYLGYARGLANAGADEEARSFWTSLYQTPAPTLELPGDRPRPDVRSFAGATATRRIDSALLSRLKKMAAAQNCSLFSALFGGAQVLFGKLAGENDVVIGTPMAGQSLVEDGALVGHCVNFLPQRVPFTGASSFADHMQAVREQLFKASDYQSYTFGSLLRDLDIKRSLNRMPLTTLQFNYERVDGAFEIDGVKSRFSPNPKAFINFDIFMNVAESADELRIDAIYSTALFDEATINRWLAHYEHLLDAIATSPQQPIDDIALLTEEEVRYLRDDLNRTQIDYDLSQSTPLRIAQQASKTPTAAAVADDQTRLSYGDLDARSSNIAHRLLQAGVKRNSRLAIAMDRRASTVAAMLGVWKAGCAYVPIDTNMPEARIRLILENADITGVITDKESAKTVKDSGHRLLIVGDLMEAPAETSAALPEVGENDTAYVMFTSGSTGVPKGVEIPHAALTNLLLSMAETTGFAARDKLIAVTTFSFDISVLELFMPLVAGGEVFISSQADVRSGSGLIDQIREEKPKFLQATPSLWRLLLEAGFEEGADMRLLAGGEALPRDLADQLLATGAEVWNVYGPTETTIWSSAARVTDGPIVIGAPLANTSLHILNEDLRLVPTGVSGDLWIGGKGLAKGYFKRPDLTDGAFRTFAIEGAERQRFYKTGDIARRLADGSIQLLGRSDHQIKHRGYRIELEEIETTLRQAPGVADAAVSLQRIDDGSRLIGFIVSKAANADFDAVAKHAAARLSPYMVPTDWKQLDALPLNASGKLDRKALANIEPSASSLAPDARSGRQPGTDLERLIAGIWKDVLGMDNVGVDDAFFDLGADSLQLYRIVARMNKSGLKVDARRLMRNATIAELAA